MKGNFCIALSISLKIRYANNTANCIQTAFVVIWFTDVRHISKGRYRPQPRFGIARGSHEYSLITEYGIDAFA